MINASSTYVIVLFFIIKHVQFYILLVNDAIYFSLILFVFTKCWLWHDLVYSDFKRLSFNNCKFLFNK